MRRRDLLRTMGAAAAVEVLRRPEAAEASSRLERRSRAGQTPVQRWPVRGSVAFELDSKAVGDRMAVGVWQPDPQFLTLRGRPVDDPLDVVYVLDGSWALGIAAAVCTLQLVDLVKPGFPPLLLVGLDYPEGRTNARSRDYTMADSVPADMARQAAQNPATAPGGADAFLEFLTAELDPLIRSRYHTTRRPAGILGDSFGGTFTFYAFLKQSPLFDRYWLGSPGIFTTGTDYVAQVGDLLSRQLVHDTRMFLSFGELEATGGVPFYEDMGRNFKRLVSTLEAGTNERLTCRSKMYPGHTHTTVLAPALNDALLYLYGPHFPG